MSGTTDDRPAKRSVVCVTADDGRFDSTRRAAMAFAAREDVEVILYDWDAATLLGDPLPSVWSADGTETSVPDRLDEIALQASGHEAIARQVIEAKDAGLSASGWLPARHGTDALLRFAADHQAIVVVVPPELDGLSDESSSIRIAVA